MKTIGIIGGLGPQATIDFEMRLHTEAQKIIPQLRNEGYPVVISYYLRNAPMITNGASVKMLKPHKALLRAARYLGQKADFLVIASNTPHLFQRQIENASKRKVLSMVDIVAAEIKKSNIRKVGILAVGTTVKNRLYQKPLQKLKIDSITIPEKFMAKLDKVIFACMEGKNTIHMRTIVLDALNFLRKQGAEKTILGCTELPLILDGKKLPADLINPIQLLAKAAIKYSLEKTRDRESPKKNLVH